MWTPSFRPTGQGGRTSVSGGTDETLLVGSLVLRTGSVDGDLKYVGVVGSICVFDTHFNTLERGNVKVERERYCRLEKKDTTVPDVAPRLLMSRKPKIFTWEFALADPM